MTLSITLAQLRHLRACHDQLQLFERTFGAGAEITPANLAKAVDAGLKIEWMARETLKPPARKAYDEAIAPAREAYYEAIAPALEAYYKVIPPAREAYDQATTQAWNAYDQAITQAWNAYDEATIRARNAYLEAITPARKAYKAYCEVMAQAWADAYTTQEVTK